MSALSVMHGPGEARADDAAAQLARIRPEYLGSPGFLAAHRVRYAYVAGEMATGIATPAMVKAMAGAGMLGFFGSAGLSPQRIEEAIDDIERELGSDKPWGANLIHSPSEAGLEDAVADLFLRRKLRRVSASAFMKVTPAVVRYACSGLRLAHGRIERQNHLFAKVSRPEVASQFLSPAPRAMLDALVAKGHLSRAEADLAAHLPVAEDVTAEADSGGHTDNRALPVLLPVMLDLRNRVKQAYGYERPIRIGAAGGLGCPSAVAAAFSLGADYIVSGSVNQCTVEAGTSPHAKRLLAQADMADVMMAPAADMFELGVKVQVLKRGTMFAVRAAKLYQIYTSCAGLHAIPPALRDQIEKDIFRTDLEAVWLDTHRYWERRDEREVQRALGDPKHKMALVFRWYLGSASRWAQAGEPGRELDYQIWCGPAMGSFNQWAKGSFLENPAQRSVVQIALNFMEGAAVVTRAQQLRCCGVPVPDDAFDFRPRPL